MALIDTLHTIIEAENGAPPSAPSIHTPDSDRRLVISAITIEVMQGRHASMISRDLAGRILATLDSLGFEIKRKAIATPAKAGDHITPLPAVTL